MFYSGTGLDMYSIPVGTTELKINCIHTFGKQTADELADLFRRIPSTVTSLDLSYNRLFRANSCAELAFALKDLPQTLVTLDLSGNFLNEPPISGLCVALAALPPVTSVDLRKNDLDKISPAELKQLLVAIPESIALVAYDDRGFISREQINEQFDPSYSFYFKCLAGLATAGGVVMLIAGLILMQPVVAYVGLGLGLAGVVAGAGLLVHGIFSGNSVENNDNSELVFAPPSVL